MSTEGLITSPPSWLKWWMKPRSTAVPSLNASSLIQFRQTRPRGGYLCSHKEASKRINTEKEPMTYPHFAATEGYLQAFKTGFSLSAQDLTLINAVRGGPRRLARALLLIWARSKQAIATSPAELPEPLLTQITAQL